MNAEGSSGSLGTVHLLGAGSVRGNFTHSVASELGLDVQVGWGLAEMG